MSFDDRERASLAALADLLIPAGEGFPSASQAGVTGKGLDQVLSFRPDLADALKKVLQSAGVLGPAAFLRDLKKLEPAAYGALAEFVAGAYFLNSVVRARLGYRGQDARPIDPRPDYLDEGLLQSVLERGPIYRPTPR